MRLMEDGNIYSESKFQMQAYAVDICDIPKFVHDKTGKDIFKPCTKGAEKIETNSPVECSIFDNGGDVTCSISNASMSSSFCCAYNRPLDVIIYDDSILLCDSKEIDNFISFDY